MRDKVCELECNIDDMTAEELAFAAERLMDEGAKDVTLTPVQSLWIPLMARSDVKRSAGTAWKGPSLNMMIFHV